MKINNINKGAEENNKINGLLGCDTRYSMLIKIVDITLIVRQTGIQYIDCQHIMNNLMSVLCL